VIDDLLARYRERLGVYPRFFMGLARCSACSTASGW
jgi:hypothetical protein